jgi:endonuclease/exonuclease/phosphatase family metal-dependent hydrolase
MSYNIAGGNGELERIADVIRAAGADIVALQEVDVHWSERSRWADQAAELGAMLEMNVRFGPIYSLPGERGSRAGTSVDTMPSVERDVHPREFGLAILSRHPIVEFRNLVIPRLSTQSNDVEARPMPGFLEAVVRVRGVRIHVFNTHLDYRSDPRVRVAQVAAMLSLLPEQSLPVILLGDLNAPPHAAELAPLFARFNDAGRLEQEPGFTYPSAAPERRIDYVLYSDRFAFHAASVMDTPASDHLPVIADLVIMVSGASFTPLRQYESGSGRGSVVVSGARDGYEVGGTASARHVR